MILNMGIRTTDPMTVAYAALGEGEDENAAIARLLAALSRGAKLHDTSMIVTYETSEEEGRRREVLIPRQMEADSVDTKKLPLMKTAFVAFTGSQRQLKGHCKQLRRYIQ